MVNQTTVTHEDSIMFGSAKFEIGDTVDALEDLGAMMGITVAEKYDLVKYTTDNAGELQRYIKNHTVSVSGDLLEVVLSKLNAIRGGLDTYSTSTASPVSVSAEEHTLTGTTWVRLDYKNGAGTEVGSITVVNASDSAATRNTDYIIGVDSDGWTCIARVSGSAVIATGTVAKVSYTYTPLAGAYIKTGGKVTITPKVVRLTNTNAAGKVFRITVYKASNSEGITLNLQPDDADRPNSIRVTMEGVCDTDRTLGDQLMEIYSEQGQ